MDNRASMLRVEAEKRKAQKRKREFDEIAAVTKAAKPFFDYWRKKRDEYQSKNGITGRKIVFPFMYVSGSAWEIGVPWHWDEKACEQGNAEHDAFLDAINGVDPVGDRYGHDVCPHCGKRLKRPVSKRGAQE